MTVLCVKSVVVVGGGTAGWLTAGLLGAKKDANGAPRFNVTLIEPPGIPPIGVGEGTWPSMRLTLSQIGINERDFLKATGASFKQGTKFVNWRRNRGGHYYHPFERPDSKAARHYVEALQAGQTDLSFARYTGKQEDLCEARRAPKLQTSRDYAGVSNYGYHFEADGMAAFLKEHCLNNLNVALVPDVLADVKVWDDGRIRAITTPEHSDIEGDFFVDCTGFRGLLIKGHFQAQTIPLDPVFSCDRALAARIPYDDASEIESTTVSTAQEAGWIWDVSLAARSGLGYVYSSSHISADQAHDTLVRYISQKGSTAADVSFRQLKFSAGYLDTCWKKNCAAIGLSSGFVEPLEASSIMLTETAARELADDLSEQNAGMEDSGKAFNDRFASRWKQITHFLKLHYVLSERVEPFWAEHRHPSTIPASLLQDVARWKEEGDVRDLFNGELGAQSLFPLDSYRFVFHSMLNRETGTSKPPQHPIADRKNDQVERYLGLLPTNQEWLNHLSQPGN